MRLGLTCALLGACTSPAAVDGEIRYHHFINPDAPTNDTLSIQPDGTTHYVRDAGVHSVDVMVTLSPAVTDAVYSRATDADFASLPAELTCSCGHDTLESYTVMLNVEDRPYQTVAHDFAHAPSSLARLLETFDCLTRQIPDGTPESCLSQ